MIDKHIKIYLLFLCVFFTPIYLRATNIDLSSYRTSFLTIDDGLAQNTIDYIYKDSNGFMWFCTWNGLDRYDGYEFKHYNVRSVVNPMISNYITSVAEDNFKRLWIGTESGVNVINLKTGSITLLPRGTTSDNPLFKSHIGCIMKDKMGNIWFGTTKGLFVISFMQDGGIKSVNKIDIGIKEQNIKALSQMSDNKIWVGSDDGTIKQLVYRNQIFQINEAPGKIKNKIVFPITSFLSDKNHLWIGTVGGLFDYNVKNDKLAEYYYNIEDKNSLVQNYIMDLRKDSDGNLWIGTLGGLSIYDSRKNTFLRVTNHTNKNLLNNNFVNSLFIDESGIIWIGTEKGGINKFVKKCIFIKSYKNDSEDSKSLSLNPINAIYQDSQGTLWVGVVEGGLNRLTKDGKGFDHFENNPRIPTSISHNTVSYILEDSKKSMWFATWGNGLNRLKDRQQTPLSFEHYYANNDFKSIRSNFVSAIVEDKPNNVLWVSTNKGLNYFDYKTNRFVSVLENSSLGKIINMYALFIDKQRRLWIGTGVGLFCIDLNKSDLKKGKIKHYEFISKLDNPNIKVADKINCINQSKNGDLWFGSSGNGLYKLSSKSNSEFKFINYDVETGLSNSVIYAILEDDLGNLWLSTDKGLNSFSPQTASAKSYFVSDGLLDNQFYWSAGCKTHDGNLYFGCVKGVVYFDPCHVVYSKQSPKVVITRFRVLNEEIFPEINYSLNQNTDELPRLDIDEKDKSFSFDFSALQYDSQEKIRYAYMLEGFDNDWIEVESSRRYANYTNIKAGKYIFKVKCTNVDRAWSENISQFEVVIIPPFYKRFWFICLVLIIGAYAVYNYYTSRMKRLRQQRDLLEKMVNERTEKIEKQKVTLEQQAKDLESTLGKLIKHQEEISAKNETLISQNNKISYQKEQLIKMSKKIKDVNQERISFFTNITHEFKTPITLILGPLERALKLSQNPKVIEQLSFAQRNSKYLLSLINQLMDFRKIDSENMVVSKSDANLAKFINEIIIPFEELAGERNIQIIKHIHLQSPYIKTDSDKLQKIISNIFSNAIKFTPDNGLINLYLTVLPYVKEGNDKWLYISVNDNGCGIPSVDLDKVFMRFYQSEKQPEHNAYGQTGTGIGLYLCRRLTQLLGGKIYAKNNSKGASIRLFLPYEIGEEAPDTFDFKAEEALIEHYVESVDSFEKDKLLLLIVEDNKDMRAYIKTIFSDRFNILEAPDGKLALDLTMRFNPHLIISDVMMPVMDGFELCRKVKNNFLTSHIPVLLLTAKSSTDKQIEGFNVGADAYLLKPFDDDLLVARVNNILESRERVHKKFLSTMNAEELNITNDSQDKQFLDKVLGVVTDNYKDPYFDVMEFTAKMGVSRSLLHRKLDSLVGQSASKLIRTFRLNKAQILIEQSNRSKNISEIAYDVGFNDPKYFTRCFTKHFGFSPSNLIEKNIPKNRE